MSTAVQIKQIIVSILDEEDTDPMMLYNEFDEPTSFNQIAVISYDEQLYSILKPIDSIEDIAEMKQ